MKRISLLLTAVAVLLITGSLMLPPFGGDQEPDRQKRAAPAGPSDHYGEALSGDPAGHDEHTEYTVNAILGDKSFVDTFGRKPGSNDPDHIRIATHLQYVEEKLRDRPTDHLTPEQKENRSRFLDMLSEYRKAGEFPRNDGHPDKRRPTFIDNEGNICAVGYLVEQSAGREVAEQVSERFKYAFLPDIEHPMLDKWADRSGFSTEELAMIQPMYQQEDHVEKIEGNNNRVGWSYGLASAAMTTANAAYLANDASDPYLFNSAGANHWFGMAAGAGSLVLGAMNLDNTRTTGTVRLDSETGEPCAVICYYTLYEYTETNHARTAVSAANMGVGVFNMLWSGYHLFFSSGSQQEPSRYNIGVTHLDGQQMRSGEPVPALQFRARF